MSNRYSHLLSPLKIGNVVLKNRMMYAIGHPHFFQGPETFPAEPLLAYYTHVAKNGAAIVTFTERDEGPNKRLRGQPDMMRSENFEMTDPSVQNYLSQLAGDVHFYGCKLAVASQPRSQGPTLPDGYVFSPKPPTKPGELEPDGTFESLLMGLHGKMFTSEMLDEIIDNYIERLKLYQSCGFDMVEVGYLETYLSPLTNKRTDEYGGSLENRARYPLKILRRIREAFGLDFLIGVRMQGEETKGGLTLEDTVAFAKMAEGTIDILQLRGKNSETTSFISKPGEHEAIRYAEAIKKSGVKVFVAPNGGFQNLDENEEYVASGKADIISMCRAFICDPEYGQKAYEGRGEDVVPCLRCNRCHGIMKGPWLSFCSVNPTMGIAHKLHRMVAAPSTQKKVVIIGGGPAGMEAAIVAAKRGHKVTLYEKNDFLGGQLIHGDYASFKWTIGKFKNYLIDQMAKLGVEVKLSTKATPAMIQSGGFDAVIAAMGAEPNTPDIPGINGDNNVWTCLDVYGKEQELGKNVVVVGGSQIGVETGMYLAENGHKVTVLTRQDKLAHDASPLHSVTMVYLTQLDGGGWSIEAAWERQDNFSYILRATTTGVSKGTVTYTDAEGKEKSIKADSVVICAGMNPRQEEALKFSSSADKFFIIGDCDSVGNIQKSMRAAFATASQL